MRPLIVSMFAVAGSMLVGSATAIDMPMLAKVRGCAACHFIDKKGVGPPWMEVSQKYKGDATAETKLSVKIANGGAGVWGRMPMPANPRVTPAEMNELIGFILGLANMEEDVVSVAPAPSAAPPQPPAANGSNGSGNPPPPDADSSKKSLPVKARSVFDL